KKYPILPFDSMQAQLKSAVARDDRSQVAKDVFFNSIKKKNNFKEYPENVDKLRTDFVALIADTGRNAGVLEAKSYNGPENTLFEIKGVKYKAGDLLSYAETSTRGRVVGPKGAIYDNIYDNYVRMVVNDIEEENLMNEKPEFKNLMTEYRDGIMLFELMDRNVWGKASKDSVGLAAFHKTRAANYKWQSGFRGAVYTFKSKEAMDDG